jgi:hypothetical protein
MISPINRDGLVITQPGRLEELYYNNAPVNEPLATSVMPTNVHRGLAPLYNEMYNPPTYGESSSDLQPMTLSEKKFNFQKNLESKKQKKGIANLLKTAVGFMIPGSNFIMGGGLQSLNQRIRGSDFSQATSLADYLDMQRYGGAQGRTEAAARNMAQARGLQKQIDARTSSQRTSDDRGMGQMPASTSAPRSVGISAANQGSIDPAGGPGRGRKG